MFKLDNNNITRSYFKYILILTTNMQFVPIELYQLVLNTLNLKSQINLLSTIPILYNNLYILELPVCKINDIILEQKKFSRLRIIDASKTSIFDDRCQISNYTIKKFNLLKLKLNDNKKINNIGHMSNLKTLYIANNVVRQKDIATLNLIKLFAKNNSKIHDVSHMSNLKKLNASGSSGINQKGIYGIDLIKLNVSYNNKITDISFMTNLKTLYVAHPFFDYTFTNICQRSIDKLNLKVLYANNNKDIYNLSHMTNLKILCINNSDSGNGYYIYKLADKSKIDQNEIKKLDLSILNISNNPTIVDVSHMSNLRYLYADNDSGVDQNGIRNLNLELLSVSNNPNIIDVSHMRRLKYLYANGISGINLCGIQSLELLSVSNNKNIVDVSYMLGLKCLYAEGDCGIDNNGIRNLKLVELHIKNNEKISKVSHITTLKILDCSYNYITRDEIKYLALVPPCSKYYLPCCCD